MKPLALVLLAGLCSGLAGLPAHLRAADADDEWMVRPLQTDDGLPDNSVAGVAQTPDGYLWVGTPTGLARFDGLRFESFSLTNVIAQPNRGVVSMVRGSHGSLWLGMDRGAVVCLNGGASCAYTDSLPSTVLFNLAQDGQGTCWVSYRDGSVYRLKNGGVSPMTVGNGVPGGHDICALTSDRDGRIWFAKGGKLGVVRNDRFVSLSTFNGNNKRLAAARGGGVWLTVAQELFKCDNQGAMQDWGTFHFEGPGNGSTAILEDHSGVVWIGTPFDGLFRRDASGFESIPASHQGILSLAEDNEGNIWVGTFGGGLDRIRRRAITLEGAEAGLPFASVQSLCEDSAGVVWAAAQNGVLAQETGGKWTAVPVTGEWPGQASCLAADTNGTVWVGTVLHGLYCWRNGRVVGWPGEEQLAGKTLHTLLLDKNGDLWIGQESPSAVLRLHDGKIDTYLAPPDGRIIRAMAEDASGTIWAGTSKGLLLRVKDGRLDLVSPRPDREPASIRCLAATPDGTLWIGYAGWGIGCMKDGRYAEVDSEQGLYDDYISHIISDDRGWLWFGANRGIFKVRQRELEDVLAGRATHVRSIHYGRGEGLPSLQGTFGDAPDVLRTRDGRIWLPMQTGLAVANPDRLYERVEAPPTLLTKVLVDDRVVARYGGILPVGPASTDVVDLGKGNAKLKIPPDHRSIEFEFAAFSFNGAENVQFRYRLRGLDDEWGEAGTHRSARYSRLSDGNYLFEMDACNSEGDWSTAVSRLAVVVSPFFWNTWWFRLAAVLVFTATVIAVVRYVSFRRLHRRLVLLEQQAALQKERARIAKDIHDDLGADLTQIAFLGELARQDQAEPDRAVQRIATISTTARQAIKSLDEIVWAVNPRNDTLAHLTDYAGQFAVDYLRAAGIRCRLDFPDAIPARDLSTDLRHNLFLVVKEALHNIVKHSGATEVWLRAAFNARTLELVVEDNGRGFERAPDDALADGLRNMRQRMADIGGGCLVESHPGGGTRVVISLPWPEPQIERSSNGASPNHTA